MKDSGKRICYYMASITASGAFGNEVPTVEGNIITFSSQAGEESYQINDNGSVDVLWDDIGVYDPDDFGLETYEQVKQFQEDYAHFESIRDIINAGFSWFMNLTEDDLIMINKILSGDLR